MRLDSILQGGRHLPFFYEPPTPADICSVTRQMQGRKFDASLILGTADRCRFGCPRVIVCHPLHAGKPFPTSFWLTCPWLVRRIGELEAEGGVAALENWIELRSHELWIPFNMEHQRIRLELLGRASLLFLRRFHPRFFGRLRSGGVGGSRYGRTVRVKCIHLQTASWLALRVHPGAEWLKERGAGEDCSGKMKTFCGAYVTEKGKKECGKDVLSKILLR